MNAAALVGFALGMRHGTARTTLQQLMASHGFGPAERMASISLSATGLL